MHEEWTDKLSEYLDDELSVHERRAVEAHLSGCAPCTAVLNDLKRVVARARRLESRPPAVDVWPAIAKRMRDARDRQEGTRFARLTFTVPQALAASVLIALLSGVAAWQIARHPSTVPQTEPATIVQTAPPAGPPAADQSADSDATTTMVSFADAQYDAAVADLQRALGRGRGRLDKATVAIVEHNLQIIDHAIEQARQALDADPANEYLSSHLVEARRRKLDLLRRAAALADAD